MSHIHVICRRVHATEKTEKQGLTVTSARLPSGCPCCSMAATCGHHRWGLGFSTRLAQAADSLSGERILTGFPSETMLWINKVEMVDSLGELTSSRSVAGKNFPKFEMLDAKIASALNKITQNFHFKKKVSLEEQKAQKEGRFLPRRQIAFMIYDYFRVTGAHDTVLDYADLLSVVLQDDNVQEFDTRWDAVLCFLCPRFHLMTSWKSCTN